MLEIAWVVRNRKRREEIRVITTIKEKVVRVTEGHRGFSLETVRRVKMWGPTLAVLLCFLCVCDVAAGSLCKTAIGTGAGLGIRSVSFTEW